VRSALRKALWLQAVLEAHLQAVPEADLPACM